MKKLVFFKKGQQWNPNQREVISLSRADDKAIG
jgi:hypothetical protein